MQRKRPLDAPGSATPAAGGPVPLNDVHPLPGQTFYEDTPIYDKDFNDKPPAKKRSAPDVSSYYPDYNSPMTMQNTDSWVAGYEREMVPSQYGSYQASYMEATKPTNYEYDYRRSHQSAMPQATTGPSRKLTCELPMPALPERIPNSRYGLGLDRYGHELPSPLMNEFQDIVKEMKDEIAFLKRHPEVTCRIPHALRILEREAFKLEKCIDPDWLEVDINKPINLCRKVLIPTNRFPAFNFIGKIIGTRGATLQNLGKTFKCHITLSGEGSSRNRQKETQLFASGEERYLHYGLPLFIQISTIARPHIAFMRVAGFLNVLHKLLIPSHDVHIAGITDGNTWYESDETFVYDPMIFDETADEQKEAELRSCAAGVALRKPPRFSRGGAESGRGGRGGLANPNYPSKDDYVMCYDVDQQDGRPKTPQPPPVENPSSSNGDEFKIARGGGVSSRGAPRSRGRGRGAVPIRRG